MERERLESEWREQLNAANETAVRAQKVLEEKDARCRQLDEEVTGLRQECDGLRDKFVAEQQVTLDASRRIESIGWLVEKDQTRSVHNCLCQLCELLHPQ